MTKNYTTKTAALRATKADINKLNAKRMLLNGKNILEYISDSEFNSYDTRDPQLKNDELDIWNTEISLSDNNHIEVKPHVHGIKRNEETDWETVYEGMMESQVNTLKSAVKIIDNEVLGADDNHLMFWQTDGLTNGFDMFSDCSNLTTFTSDLSSLTEGSNMFSDCSNLTTFTSDLSSLTEGSNMFSDCSNLTTFTSDLSSLTTGGSMFWECSNLTTFTSDLSSLTIGSGMFQDCSSLTTFTSDLSSLTNGLFMFRNCSSLTTFTSDLSSLPYCSGMFQGCSSLTTFTSDLSSLQNGYSMFQGCSSLTTFTSDLSSLTNGNNMFDGCKLDTKSVATIITFLPSHSTDESTPVITIGIGIPDTDEAKQAFAEECYYEDWADLNADFDNRNWIVQWQFNGEATTFNLRSPRPSTAVYAKLEEVIMPSDENVHKPYYKYTSIDGTKFYNIHWYHESNMEDESYTLFDSLEAAIESYNIVLKS